MLILKYGTIVVLLTVPAHAQTNGTYLLTSSNTVSPSSPTTTIEIWAAWNDPTREYGFGGGNYDLTAGDGVFSNAANILNGPGSSAGIISGNVISSAGNGQVYIPTHPVRTDNPILLATYDWTATDFTPRFVPLDTSNTTNFILVWNTTGGVFELYPNEFTPGSGVITVVPAPVAWFALALPLAACRKRRC